MRLLVGVFGLALLFAAAPRNDRWRILGPGGGGAMFYPTVSPHDPKFVFVACDMTGSYVTHDGGDTWRMINLRGVSKQFVFDHNNRDVVYAVTNALWRTSNRGATWKLVWPEPARITGTHMRNDHADERFVVGGKPAPRVSAFAVHPKRGQELYIAAQDGVSWELITSIDNGATWAAGGLLPSGTRRLYVSDAGTVYAIAQDAVHIRRDKTWHSGAKLERIQDASAGWSSNGELVVYAVDGTTGHVSEDSGRSWRDFRLDAQGVPMSAIATSLKQPAVAYVSYSRMEGEWFGVAKTTDGGRTWKPVWREARDQRAANVKYGWIAERFGSAWAGNPLTLGVSPTNPELAFATDFGRTLRTTDGGATWKTLYSERMRNGGWVSTGLDVTTAYSVHFDPFHKNRIFISYTDIGAFRSEDGGKSWVGSTQGIERAWTNTTYDLAFDPDVRGKVWGVFSGTHDLPRPKMWRKNSPASYRGGGGVSTDGGRTWRMLKNAGMPETAPTHIIIDLKSPPESRTLYIAAFGRGVYKSTNGGTSWTLKNSGLPGPEPFAWRFAHAGTGELYVVIARRSDDGTIGGPGDGGLFRSTDGAETWKRVSLPQGVNGPNGLAIDPKDPKRLYLAAWGRRTNDENEGGGIFRSEDGGKSWVSVLTRDRHIYDVTIDPKNPAILYACGFESSAWRSTNRGDTWQRIPGYNFKWGHRVIPDPHDDSRIYITTFGGSVWHGPVLGDARAREDLDAPWLRQILEQSK